MNKDGLFEKAQGVQKLLVNEGFMTEFDDAGSIGRRYARADEAGVPLGVTVDYDTLRDDTVTIRNRDSWRQVRSSLKDLPQLLEKYFQGKINFEDMGTLVPASS
jgi:glycyl-tRNA synthetase